MSAIRYAAKVVSNIKELAKKDKDNATPNLGANVSYGIIMAEIVKAYQSGFEDCLKKYERDNKH